MTVGDVSREQMKVGVSSTIRQFLREPINLVLLVVLPVILISTYGSIMSAFPELPYMTASPETIGAMAGTLFVAAFLPGVIGLFQVISAKRADERLSVTGFSRSALFASRLLAILLASLLTATISMTVLSTRIDVESVGLSLIILVFVGGLYGLIGMLIGVILPRELEGSLVLIFFVDMDEALASGIMQTDATIAKLFPLHYPHKLFQAAVDGNEIVASDVVAAGVYAIILLAVTLHAYTALTDSGGVLS
ncbi:MAG: ABC transporter permease [Halobacteriaceae archaeon]